MSVPWWWLPITFLGGVACALAMFAVMAVMGAGAARRVAGEDGRGGER